MCFDCNHISLKKNKQKTTKLSLEYMFAFCSTVSKLFYFPTRDDRHGPPAKKAKDEDKEEEEDLNDANYDEVH